MSVVRDRELYIVVGRPYLDRTLPALFCVLSDLNIFINQNYLFIVVYEREHNMIIAMDNAISCKSKPYMHCDDKCNIMLFTVMEMDGHAHWY